MNAKTTSNIQPGTVLYLRARNPISHYPQVSHRLYTVSRVTPTQAIAVGDSGEIRVRLSDLKVIGEDYCTAGIASDELQARHAAEVQLLERFRAAHRLVADLIGKEMHQLKLSTAQLEALAAAWVQVKSMGKT